MAGFIGRELEDRNDYGSEINDNYDSLSENKYSLISREDEIEAELFSWEQDIQLYLEEKGVDLDIEKEDIPLGRKRRLLDYYYSQAFYINDYGYSCEYDPTLNFYPKSSNTEKALEEIGTYLGRCDHIGECYKILSLLPVARSYWISKYNRAIGENNKELITELKHEIEIFDPNNYKQELKNVKEKGRILIKSR